MQSVTSAPRLDDSFTSNFLAGSQYLDLFRETSLKRGEGSLMHCMSDIPVRPELTLFGPGDPTVTVVDENARRFQLVFRQDITLADHFVLAAGTVVKFRPFHRQFDRCSPEITRPEEMWVAANSCLPLSVRAEASAGVCLSLTEFFPNYDVLAFPIGTEINLVGKNTEVSVRVERVSHNFGTVWARIVDLHCAADSPIPFTHKKDDLVRFRPFRLSPGIVNEWVGDHGVPSLAIELTNKGTPRLIEARHTLAAQVLRM